MTGETYQYIPRLTDTLLREKLEGTPAVLVRGPKWTGKTSSCERLAKSSLLLRDPDVYVRALDALVVQPSLLLRGDRPRLIDEWQLAPELWDAVISEADKTKGTSSQFLLTGSATPVNVKKLRHTGTGRIARLTMETMTLEESGESSEEVSLATLFQGDQATGVSTLTVEDYARIICRGGWPAVVTGMSSENLARDYVEALCESDMAEAVDVELDPDRARALIRSLARNSAQEANNATLLEDVRNAGVGMSDPTLRTYLNALRRLFVLEEVKAWAPTLRSRTPLRSTPVRHLCDPSIAAAALETNPEGLLNDLSTMGFLFESLCVRDLRVYARLLGGDVYHYRDKSGLEADVIIRLRDGRWAAIEVKLGGEARIDEGAAHLAALQNKIDVRKSGSPSFLMVLTGTAYAYTRPDGVHVVPVGCLCH
ncbi:ATP-binding protein [Adlercreutzia sp. ZJ138]|uniref:ATP-binding protein n=1 Tax=Adlercreutzia sp. ZJ138 TaxID=2709405 RepID=UPI0013EC06B2|nr:DUF4143 domain-containing protein [Adlercreutzia sp. ZJ138]